MNPKVSSAAPSVLHSFHNCSTPVNNAPQALNRPTKPSGHTSNTFRGDTNLKRTVRKSEITKPCVRSKSEYRMSNRFGRDTARNDLFSTYNRSASPSKSKNKARASPYNSAGGYGLPSPSDGPGFSAYPGASTNGSLYGGYGGSSYGVGGSGQSDGGYRSATPNSRGQYNSATLDELESQNDEQTGVLIGKVKMLKDVRPERREGGAAGLFEHSEAASRGPS